MQSCLLPQCCRLVKPLAARRLPKEACFAKLQQRWITSAFKVQHSARRCCQARSARRNEGSHTKNSTRPAKFHRYTHSSTRATYTSHRANALREDSEGQWDAQQAKATDFISADSLQKSSSTYASPDSSAYQSVTPSFQAKQKQGDLDPSFWAHKPYWCQPWSILLTGTLFVLGARQLFHGNNIVTALAAVPILVWWYLFLVLVPANYRSFVKEE